jgi:hypothetical protein
MKHALLISLMSGSNYHCEKLCDEEVKSKITWKSFTDKHLKRHMGSQEQKLNLIKFSKVKTACQMYK